MTELGSILASLALIVFGWKAARFRRSLSYLRDVKIPSVHVWPKLSLVIPACNEANTLSPAVSSLLAIDYPSLELVLIDDRSTDGTLAVMRGLAERDSRIRIVRVDALPAGWLGKVHALHQGLIAASGEWILFSDADVHFRAQSLKKALAFCDEKKIDFLTVSPSVVGGTWASKVFVTHFLHGGTLNINLGRTRDPRKPDAIGAGAFNLFRRQSYNQSLGLEWLKLEVIDDIGLAFTMKKAGARTDFLSGLDEVEIEWYPNAKGFIQGFEKNGFAPFQYSPFLLFLFCLCSLLFLLGFTVAPLVSHNRGIQTSLILCLVFYIAESAAAARMMMKISWPLVFLPLAWLTMPALFVRSAALCLFRGGVRWRGTFYPLRDLKAGQRLKLFDLIWRESSSR